MKKKARLSSRSKYVDKVTRYDLLYIIPAASNRCTHGIRPGTAWFAPHNPGEDYLFESEWCLLGRPKQLTRQHGRKQ
ncbi:hypothetical protein GQ600_2250 [Phytophthora cactorum]|nr:hypothetical protein GQ600_2250 [Phytophthora cactorum]